jgi:type I restriction enzyme S subunit
VGGAWEQSTIGEVAETVTDGDHRPPKRASSGIPHATARNIKNRRIDLAECTYVTQEGFNQTRSRYEPRPGDLIVTCVGTIGRTAIVPGGLVFSADRNLAGIRLGPGARVDIRFLQVVLNAPQWQQQMRVVSGSTAQPHLYLRDLRALPLPVPPLLEQERILAEVDRQVSMLEHLQVDVDRATEYAALLRSSVLARALTGRLVPQDTSDAPASVLLERIRTERAAAGTPARNGRKRASAASS